MYLLAKGLSLEQDTLYLLYISIGKINILFPYNQINP